MAFNNRQYPNNGRRNFQGNNNRGGNFQGRNNYQGGQRGGNFQRGGNGNGGQADFELRGILWGNGFRDQQKEGAPVLQGYLTVKGVKYRVSLFLNVGKEFANDQGAHQDKEVLAADINNMILDAQQSFGAAFSIKLEEAEEQGNGGGGQQQARGGYQQRAQGSGGSRGYARGNQDEPEEENIPFNRNQQDAGDAPEPEGGEEAEARPTRTRTTRAAAKPAAKATRSKTAAKTTKRGK